MSDKSNIEWTDASCTPVRAKVKTDAAEIASKKGYTSLVQIAGKMAGRVGPHCEHASPGCDHCYSEANNERCLPSNGTGLPFDRRSRDLVDLFLDEKILMQPLKWRTPKRIFWNSQTDMFADFVPDEMIDQQVSVMALTPHHTHLVLTKRSARLREYFANAHDRLADRFFRNVTMARGAPVKEWASVKYFRSLSFDDSCEPLQWPLPNVWLGVSVENQQYADERIPLLLQTPAAVRFLSCEPCLGEIDLTQAYWQDGPGIDWCIAGAESGHGARAMEEGWARGIKDQCVTANVPFFFKQAAIRGRKIPTPELDGQKWMQMPTLP